jgi:predicted hydrocarbon binding protein
MSEKSDSKTFDVSRISIHDERLTLRINSELKKAFIEHCRAKGLSVCHILEGLIYGYLRGFYDKIELDVKSPTINLTLVRDVKRVRRYAKEAVEEKDVNVDKCRFCKKAPIGKFIYQPTEKQYPLCEYHAKEFVTSHGSWRVIRESDSMESLKSEVES